MAQQPAALFLTVCIAIPAATGKPNILFILADDLGVMDVMLNVVYGDACLRNCIPSAQIDGGDEK